MIKLNKKLFASISSAIVLVAVATPYASANTPPVGQRYARTFTDGTFIARVSMDNQSAFTSEAMTRPLNSTGPLGSMASAAFDVYNNLQTELGNKVVEQANANGFKAQPGVLNGPLDLSISSAPVAGYPTGTLKVSMSGPRYGFTATGTVSKFGVSVTCDDSITFNSVALSFYYNPINNTVVGVDKPVLNPSQSVRCSSNIDFIPVIGDLANNYAENVAKKMVNSFLSSSVSQVMTKGVGQRLFGMETWLPNKAVVVNGKSFDVGSYVRGNLTNILQTSGTVSVHIGGQITDADYQDDGMYGSLAVNVFKMSFTNAAHSYSVSLDANANYNEKLICLVRGTCPNLP